MVYCDVIIVGAGNAAFCALCAVLFLLGHTKMGSTVRYLGVEFEDTLAISGSVGI